MRSIPRVRQHSEPVVIQLTCRSRIKKWAFDNAYMLILMGVCFWVTWIAIFILGVYVHAKG